MGGRRAAVAIALVPVLGLACGSSKPGFTPSDAGADVQADSPNLTLCNHADCDGDGYRSPADCNDNDPLINPEAFDFVGDGIDDDCDGKVDDPVLTARRSLPRRRARQPTSRAPPTSAPRTLRPVPGTVVRSPRPRRVGSGAGTRPGADVVDVADQAASRSPSSRPSARIRRARARTMVGLANGPWAAADPRSSMPLDPMGFHINDACSAIPLMGADCAVADRRHARRAASTCRTGPSSRSTVKVPSNVQTVVFDFSFFSSEFNQWWQSAANDAFFVLVTSKRSAGTERRPRQERPRHHHQQRVLPALPRAARADRALDGQGRGHPGLRGNRRRSPAR